MIIGIGGNLSGGKTVTGIKLLQYGYLHGKKIISNIPLTGLPHTYMTSTELIDFIKENLENEGVLEDFFYNSIMLWDEARNFVSSRKSMTDLNEFLTQFLMMLGKLDCDFLYTYQVLTSMIDVQVREITDFHLICERLDEKGNRIIGKRKLNVKIWIRARVAQLEGDKLVFTGAELVFDPSPYYKLYNTCEIVLVNREKYKKDYVEKDGKIRIMAYNRWLTQFDLSNLHRMLPHNTNRWYEKKADGCLTSPERASGVN